MAIEGLAARPLYPSVRALAVYLKSAVHWKTCELRNLSITQQPVAMVPTSIIIWGVAVIRH